MTDTPSLISDVDDTIRYWREQDLPVCIPAYELKCSAQWEAVRATMIAIALAKEPQRPKPPQIDRYDDPRVMMRQAPRRAA